MKWELDDYQVDSQRFLAARKFACLFDSPGVGKTAPAIVAAAARVEETGKPALITAPAYLLGDRDLEVGWEWEISRFAPGARVVKANGNGQQARRNALATEGADFILTSYNNWSAKTKGKWTYPELHSQEWACTVFDEVHRLRGRNSACTKHVFELRRARAANGQTSFYGLSGTPIVNNPGDMFPLLHLWDKVAYRSYWNFVGDWCHVTQTPWSTEVGQLRKGLDDDFQELLGQFSMRRTLKDIPKLATLEETHNDIVVEMPASVRRTIATAKKEYTIEHPDLGNTEFVSGGGALYSKLRRLATNPPTKDKPKIDFARDFLEDTRRHVVVYTWYKDSARAVADELCKTKRPVTLITGDVPSENRGALVDQWKKSPNGVLIATISSLKEGISLTIASHVVFLEHSELPADQEQCVARLKRRGQNNLVHVYHVWAKATPDIAIRRCLNVRNLGLKRALTTWLLEED